MAQSKTETEMAAQQGMKANQALDPVDKAVSVIDDMNIQIASATKEQW